MSTDCLIPLGTGSRNDNLELKYCLRSIEKHLKGAGNVFLVGECPEFVNKSSLIHIPFEESSDNKHRAHNIYSKIMAGINYVNVKYGFVTIEEEILFLVKQISDNFLFMNDDHFLLTDYQASEFPYYRRGLIETHRQGNEAQRIQMENTVAVLKDNLINNPVDFDVHTPILYNKQAFIKLFGAESFWPDYGYGIKSMYCNFNRIEGEEIEDLKFSEPLLKDTILEVLKGRQMFSTGDKVFRSGGMKEVLEELYSTKSKYEL